MDEICRNILNKITSYDIFNNFFPGIIFCYLIEYITSLSLVADLDIWEKIFVYYFWGMVISRIGSLIIEKLLMFIKVKNKETNEKENFLVFEPYERYSEAAENKPIIEKLSEINNTYRTFSTVFALAILFKLYDLLLLEKCNKLSIQMNAVLSILILILLFSLFIASYRKQTNYIRNRVEKYFVDKEKGDK